MQVIWLDEDAIGEPVAGTVYEDLLARIPDNDFTRRLARLSDYAGVMDYLGLTLPEPGEPESTILRFFNDLNDTATRTGFAPDFPAWPQASRDYLSILERYPYVGFEHWRLEQSVHAGQGFGTFRQAQGPLRLYDIAFGDFDPQRTVDALAQCDCDQPDIREHDGIEYYSWGPEFIGEIEKRHSPPLYDHVGRGPRLLILEGEAYYSVSDGVMEDYIDVLQGNVSPLTEVDGYIETARALASLGLMRDMTFVSSGLTVETAVDLSGQPTLFPQTARKVDLMRPFELAATGVGFDGERAFTGLVITNPDEVTAEFNAERLVDRVWNVPMMPRSDQTLSERLERLEIAVSGNILLARFYFHHPQQNLIGFPLLGASPLILYE